MNMIALSLVALAASAAEPAAPSKAEEGAAGKAVYAAKCASCHGKDGKGSPAMAKMFKVPAPALDLTAEDTLKKSDAELQKVVVSGKAKMPAFKGKLKDGEIADVLAYTRSLAPVEKAPAPGGGEK